MKFPTHKNNYSFTLIELLVVLALVAILSVVVILTLNPAELIKQARDSNRLSDLSTINTALNLFSADVTSGFMGTSTVVYVSIPSTLSDCSNLGLPTLPSTYTYNCATTANLRNTDGTGWIPVNFQRISSNSPVSQLPVDPINTTSTRLYYAYVAGGSWELNATIEASKNKLGGSGDLVSKDGGSASSQYEIGNNLNLNPLETGDSSLVGYWNFEEGPNATSSDKSGYGNNGTWYGTGTQYVSGKVGNYSGQFNGTNGYINVNNSASLGITSFITMSAWVKTADTVAQPIASRWSGINSYAFLYSNIQCGTGKLNFLVSITSGGGFCSAAGALPNSDWHHVVGVYNGSAGLLFVDGVLNSNTTGSGPISNNNNSLIIGHDASVWSAYYFSGLMDDFRIYNRALSAAEVLALYNATK